MNSQCIDLIYLDPPFNSNVNYAAPIGSLAAGAHFKDRWSLSDVKIAWVDIIDAEYPRIKYLLLACESDSLKSYLIYMAIRLIEMKRILRDTGSIYLHCDPTAGHFLKVLMDAIFGQRNFRNEIIWGYKGPGSPKMRQFNRKHDTIFWYSKGKNWVFNADAIRVPHEGKLVARYDTDIHTGFDENVRQGKIPETFWIEAKGNGFSTVQKQPKQRTGYPTQKPLAILERIIKASSNPGDMVFDPFCGCATTLVAADRLARRWVGCDVSEKAAELVVQRIKQDQPKLLQKFLHRTDIPRRTDQGKLADYRSHKVHLYGEQKGYCKGCQKHFEARHLEVDHKIARDSGGTDHVENLQLLCSHCNKVKGNRGQEYLMNYLNMNKELLKQVKSS